MAQYNYGIDVNMLDKFIHKPKVQKKPWGSYVLAVDLPEYRLERLDILPGKKVILKPKANFESTIFVEETASTIHAKIYSDVLKNIRIDLAELGWREAVALKPNQKCELKAETASVLYVFSGSHFPEARGIFSKKFSPSDHRDKYWGEIETIVSKGGYSGKRMVVKTGKSASLEFHCRKFESYFIHSGKLLLRLKAGRGEDRFFELPKGSLTITTPGLMHQRGGLEDTVIIEISTKDEDSDSFLVEDGAKLPMPRLSTLVSGAESQKEKKKRVKRICFDIDGVICTQTTGDYENAKPIPEAIKLVNKLYAEGFKIFLFTARFMGRNQNDWKSAYEEGYDFTKKQLNSWGVKYHDLFFGKPNTDIIVDDRAVFYKPDLTLIEKEIRILFNQ